MAEWRRSSYTIIVKLENEEGKYVLVHGYTGAIDVVDSEVVSQLLNDRVSLESIEFPKLKERGYITNKTKEEEENYVMRIAEVLHKTQTKLHKFWGFIITYNCNFRCPYCFENEISHNGCQWPKVTFTEEMVDKVFDTMMKIEPHRELHKNEILLYGGEPFLRENKSIVNYIINKGKSLGYKFKVITNGYDLDYYEDTLANHENFTMFQVTIDGCKAHHNTRKKHYIEGDSFEKIVSNIGLLLNNHNKVLVRVNLDNNNFSDYEKLQTYFKEIGYIQNPLFSLSPARLLDPIQDTEINLNYLGRNDFTQKLEDTLSQLPSTQDYGIFNKFYTYFTKKKCCHLTSTSCPSQHGSFLFDPYGDIYPCLEIVGKNKYSIGHYKESLEWTDAKNIWYSTDISSVTICKKCTYALLCGGICPAKMISKGITPSCKNYHSIFSKSINRAYNAYIKTLSNS